MSGSLKQVPEIRFKGFENEWVEKRLGNIVQFINGRAYKQTELLDEGKYPVLRVGNFYTNDKWYYSNLQLPEKNYADNGDLLYTWSATFGPHIWNGTKVIYHYHIWKLELHKNVKVNFMLQILESDKTQLLSNKNGSTMVHITKKDMENKGICIPSPNEQSYIGDFFAKIDSLITTSQKKTKVLQTLKKALLQKMFASEKQCVPEIRFKGFEDEWVEQRVKDIAKDNFGGGTPKTSERKFWDGDIPWIQSSDLKIDDVQHVYSTKKISKEAIEKSAAKLISKNSIAIVTRVGVGKLALVTTLYSTSQDFLSLSNLNIDKKFAVYNLYILLNNKKENAQGTSIKGITKSSLLNEILKIPKQNLEQTRIGELFEKLDSLITNSERKTEKLQTLKKALLQKMFI